MFRVLFRHTSATELYEKLKPPGLNLIASATDFYNIQAVFALDVGLGIDFETFKIQQ